MRTFASFVSGRRSRWVVLGLWIALVAALGPLAGKFEGAQKNDQASFLPGSAESVRVLEAERGFGDGRPTVAAIVLRNPDGLTRADRRAVERARAKLAASPRGSFSPSTLSPPKSSRRSVRTRSRSG